MSSRGDTSLPPSTMLGGRYRVLEELGRGGTAVVYRVLDVSTGRELALKQLLTQPAAAQFEREFHTLAQLAHPRVIAVYDYGVDLAGRFYTMELLDGGDLKQLSPMPALRACRLMLDVCSSLALLHSRRLVHRDVTPRNVRCTRDGHAKLIDFGVMTSMGSCSHAAGTPAFIAPEVMQKVGIDGRADLFSLGATLYYTLTGRAPFEMRHLSDVREAYAHEPPAPSQLAAGVPPALDALCMSLLRIDPGQRPRSAFEVMHKLAAIVGNPCDEPLGVSQAYLTTPLLCGRDVELRAFRQRMRRAVHGSGSAVLFRGTPGVGRSRLLDACALEAKTLGVTVLRAGAGSSAPFSLTARLCEQLVKALPEASLAAAARAGVRELLFEGTELHLDARERERVQPALGAWIAQLCETHALLVLVDDVQRVDDASLSWLAALALAAPGSRLLLTSTADTTAPSSSAWTVLSKHCALFELQPLTRAEMEVLLGSVFGDVPHLSLLAERVYGVSRGSPRESLLLAQHLVDTGRVTYRDGQWTLPLELRPEDLPESASEVLRARIAALPELARKLAHAHALLGMRSLCGEQYALLADATSGPEIDAALVTLLGADILQSDGQRYQLSHPTQAELLCRMLDARDKAALHQILYEFHLRSHETHPYLLVPHLVAAGRVTDAFELMSQSSEWLERQGERAIVGIDAHSVAESLARMLDVSTQLARPPRDAHELRRRLCALAVVSDDALHARAAPEWLAQLCRDSGLDDYRALDAHVPASERLRCALEAAQARFSATPEHARVYGVQEAIRYLAVYVVTSIVIAVRAADTRLIRSLPELIEPFASLSPALHAIWQNVVGLVEKEAECRKLSAWRRHREVYEHLCALKGHEIPYVESIRGALGHSVGAFEAYLGRPGALEWAALLDGYALQRVAAMDIRRTLCVVRGEAEQAAHYEQRVELLSLRAEVRSMFDRAWLEELDFAVLTSDLARIKYVIDEAQRSCATRPLWEPFLCASQGYFLLLRGEPAAALGVFERSLAAGEERLGVWVRATTGSMLALSALGRDDAAAERGEAALATCATRGVELAWHFIARALALAEAQLGRLPQAVERVEQVMRSEEQDDVFGLHRAATYETRVRLALRAGDLPTARAYARLALQARGGEASATARAHVAPLIDEARKLGLCLDLGPSTFEQVLLGEIASRAAPAALAQLLGGCAGQLERAGRTLEILCGLARAAGGHLFLVGADGNLQLTAAHAAGEPSEELYAYVRGFFAQQLDDELLSEVVTRATHMLSLPGVAVYYGEDGVDRHLIVLSCKQQGELVFVGVALLAPGEDGQLDRDIVAQASALALELLVAGDCPGVRPR